MHSGAHLASSGLQWPDYATPSHCSFLVDNLCFDGAGVCRDWFFSRPYSSHGLE